METLTRLAAVRSVSREELGRQLADNLAALVGPAS
jgi:hypothetical protein